MGRGGIGVGGEVLRDYLRPGLRLVVCGTAVGKASARRGHYYAGTGNEFWALLHRAGLTPVELSPEEDARVLAYGVGLTDLAKGVAASSDHGLEDEFNVGEFVAKIKLYGPAVVAFHGKKAAEVVSRYLGHGRKVRLGRQPWRVGNTAVFVLPNASGANRDRSRLEGRASRVEWYRELADLLRQIGDGHDGAKAS
jgi:TDG/mug DNA glycosylase family protein